MSFAQIVRSFVPAPLRKNIKRMLMPPQKRVASKQSAELGFWRSWIAEHGSEPEAEYYRKFMMDMGNVQDIAFFENKICLDIGCGPKGSLTWLANARYAVGLDPLAEGYAEFGIRQHPMLYLKAQVEEIPMPSAYVDVVFSMNSLDHVDDLKRACQEIRRVLKPGGHFIGSLNLEEPYSVTEPWTLTEDLLQKLLFFGWDPEFYKVRPKADGAGHFVPYRYFYEECPAHLNTASGPKALWCRFRTP
jgi:ubiquinone/menaquinone biosynthesis C-methylase UbiE